MSRALTKVERALHAKAFFSQQRSFNRTSTSMVTTKRTLSFVAGAFGCRFGWHLVTITRLQTTTGGSAFTHNVRQGCVQVQGSVMRFVTTASCAGQTNSRRACSPAKRGASQFARTRFRLFRDGIRVNFQGNVLNFKFQKRLGG